MAGVSHNQSGDSLNTELNLVPFIDLLSSLILFLLVTAVWLQVGTITVSADSKGKAVKEQAPKPTLFVHLGPDGYNLRLENVGANGAKVPALVPKVNGEFDFEKLIAELKQSLGTQLPETAAISSDDNISYKNVIHAVDAMKQVGFPSVALGLD